MRSLREWEDTHDAGGVDGEDRGAGVPVAGDSTRVVVTTAT